MTDHQLDRIFDSVTWIADPVPANPVDTMPYQTHHGTIRIASGELECVQLSDGNRLIVEGSLLKFLKGLGPK